MTATNFIDWANGAPSVSVCVHGHPLCDHGHCPTRCAQCLIVMADTSGVTTAELDAAIRDEKIVGSSVTAVITELRDLRKIKDAVYDERAAILCAFVKLAVELGVSCWRARHSADDASWDPAWMNIVVVNLPTGQCTWHVSDAQLDQFGFLMFDANYVWDGHTTTEKYERLANMDADLLFAEAGL